MNELKGNSCVFKEKLNTLLLSCKAALPWLNTPRNAVPTNGTFVVNHSALTSVQIRQSLFRQGKCGQEARAALPLCSASRGACSAPAERGCGHTGGWAQPWGSRPPAPHVARPLPPFGCASPWSDTAQVLVATNHELMESRKSPSHHRELFQVSSAQLPGFWEKQFGRKVPGEGSSL